MTMQAAHVDHPLWEKQVELERGMLREGADRVRDRTVEATNRKQMTRLDPVRGLISDWLPAVAERLKDYVHQQHVTKGIVSLAAVHLKEVDPYVASLVALRCILDGITVERMAATALSMEIGRSIEHEQQVRLWEKREPKLFHAQRKKLEAQHATDAHTRRVNINRFNALLEAGLFNFEWEPWSELVHCKVGAELLNIIMSVTGWFETAPDPDHDYRKAGGKRSRPRLFIAAKPGLTEWVGKALDAQELALPAFQPTIIPPKRWQGTKDGGYFTPYVKTPRLVRFKASQQEQKDWAAEEYDALSMPEVYEALHFVQETPWRVNKRVYDVVAEIFAKDWEIANIPVDFEVPMPKRPVGYDSTPDLAAEDAWRGVSEEDSRKWRKEASSVHSKNAKRMSSRRGASRTFRVATGYKDFERFYFPHMMDFRGRMYPIPVGLQPQGDDLARGLLEFAEGKPIDERSAGWLAIQVASAWGNDKVSFDDRIAWVEEREEMWRRIASDPIGTHSEWAGTYKKGEKPLQLLAAIFDWVGFLDHGFGYVSHAAIAVDGTCNGIQHLSAMTRDAVAGEHVNLTPSDAPRDIYKHVADLLRVEVARIAKSRGEPGAHAKFWLKLLGKDWPRGLTKRQVMVVPYGGTKEAFFKYTLLWLDENHPASGEDDIPLRYQRCGFLANLLWETVKGTVSGGVEIMEWIKKCAKLASVGNQPIFWTTPAGFSVRHFYGQEETQQVKVMLDGTVFQLRLPTVTEDLNVREQLLGIAPNFVHSLDAAALIACIGYCIKQDVTAFTAIHDSFGTHAADMWALSECLRRAFVRVHSTDVLAGFRQACLAVMATEMVERLNIDPQTAAERADDKLPPPLAPGSLDLEDVMRSEYFFA